MPEHPPWHAGRLTGDNAPPQIWEYGLLAAAVATSLALGFSHLGTPSLWHDELVHVFVAKSVAATGHFLLPSGRPYVNASLYNAILAAFIRFLGDGEAAVRTPSVLLGAACVGLTYVVTRTLLGRACGIVAAFALALSPWSVAWSREARPYALQQLLYLCMLYAAWRMLEADSHRASMKWAAACLLAYLAGAATSLHSILFLLPLGVYALAMAAHAKRLKSRWTLVCAGVAVVGLVTLCLYRLTLPKGDQLAIFAGGGLGGDLEDAYRQDRDFYLRWLYDNLSTAYFALALAGTALMLPRAGRRGLFAASAFWVPVCVLTWLVGYRRPRFMYFAFPFYAAAFSFALVALARFLTTAKRSWIRTVLAIAVVAFGLRLAWSTARLVGDSLEVARGADVTLARKHPQWRQPCQYVRERLDGTVVLSTMYLPALYYVGRCDSWYPSRTLPWEKDESGIAGLADVAALRDFVAAHPKGYFLAEWWRFYRFDFLAEDVAWVEAHMTRLPEASSEDVTVFCWGLGDSAPEEP